MSAIQTIRVIADVQPLVHIVTATGEDFEAAVDAANSAGGSVDAVAAHHAQWDYGSETEQAVLLWPDGMPTMAILKHQLHLAETGGLVYVLQLDHGLRHFALYRPTLTEEV